MDKDVSIAVEKVELQGRLAVPDDAAGIVVFAHGSGSSRHSRRNQFVAQEIEKAGMATLLFDLLTPEEDAVRDNRFDIPLLTRRLVEVCRWTSQQDPLQGADLALFGASTGAAAALNAAVELGDAVRAVVSRGGRVDLAPDSLPQVSADTLLIVGEQDWLVLDLNRRAFAALTCRKSLEVVPVATHLFEEPGALEAVARLAVNWFGMSFKRVAATAGAS